MAKLLECAEALEEAQQAALSGEGAQDLRSASRAERKAVDQLLAASRDLRPEGRKPSGAILERVRVTFQAAAGDPELRERIRAGRVVEEPAAGGAWPFGGLPEGGAEKAPAAKPTKPRREKPAPSRRDRRPASRRETEEEKEEKDDAGRAERERQRAAEREEQQRADEERAARRRELKGELTEARKAARNAARERERAQRDAERATERLERLAAEAAAAREAAESAAARRDAAEAEADAAEAEVERIEDELRDR